MKYTPEKILTLNPNQVFVFGSNLLGRHGKGAAKTALEYGALLGRGIGLWGQTYAIPTKDKALNTMPINSIKPYVDQFIEFAVRNPHLEFLVTKIGCGLAGYIPRDIAPLFKIYPPNVILPKEFHECY